MTHEAFRASLDAYDTAVIGSGIKAGQTLRVMRLSRGIEDRLVAAEDRSRQAREAMAEGNTGMATRHHRLSQEYLQAARHLISQPDGPEAYRLAKERTNG